MSAFAARYPGICTECEGRIHPGEEVEYLTSRRQGRLVHVACSDELPEPTEGALCPRCFLRKALSGECGCEP